MSAQPETSLPLEVAEDTFALDTSGTCYVVVTGEVRIFAASSIDAMARRPIGRIPQGGLLFGVGTSFFGDETLVAVKARNTVVYALPGDEWTQPVPRDAFVQGLELWLSAVTSGVARVIEPKPRPDVLVFAGMRPLPAAAGAVVGNHTGLVWAKVEQGARLLGLESVRGTVPLPAASWLVLDHDGPISAIDIREALAQPDWAESLAAYHEALVELLPLVRGLGEADEFNRLKSRRSAHLHAEHQTAERFAEVLGNPPQGSAGSSGEHLLDVMRILAQTLDLRLTAPVRARQAQVDRPATAIEIARASNVRLQPAVLKGSWWSEDRGVLLGERLSGEPVALLRANGGYDEIDRHGSSRRVTPEVAAQIKPAAQTMFKPRKLGPVLFSTTLFDSLRGSGRDLFVFLGTMLVASAIAQVLPLATGFILGVLAPSAMTGPLTQVGIAIVLIGMAGYVTQVAGEVAHQRVTARSNGLLYSSIWDRIATLPIDYFRKQGSAELVGRAGSAVSVPSGVQMFMFTAASSIGLIASSLVSLAISHPVIALLALAMVVLQGCIGALAGYLQARAYLNGEQLEGLADSMFVQMINGLVKLRSAGAEDRAVIRWADRFAAMRARTVKSRRVGNVHDAWLTAFSLLSAAALFAVIVTLNQGTPDRALPVAQVVATLTAFAILLTAVGQLTTGLLSVWLMAPSWKYAKPVLEAQPESDAGRSDPGVLSGDIEFSGVSFRYSDAARVFEGLSFRAAAGEMIAIVGPSGSGKSTLVRLVLGLETPASGAIYVDGQDLRSLQATAYRSQVGSVLQEGKLPPGTLLDIVRGTTDASPDTVWQALTQAAIAEEIAAMPMGLHTLLHDAARTMSGGQVQRLALARAFLQQPAILILDEATSALDNTTQAIAMNTILAMRATRIVIAHRISTIRHADRILVLDTKGRIAEQGTYAELMELDGEFAALARA